MKNKIGIILLILVILNFLSLGCGINKIKVGVILSFVGENKEGSEYALKGFKLATKMYNEKNKLLGKTIELIVRDDKDRTDLAFDLTQKLIKDQKIDALIGGYTSKVSLVIAPLTVQNKIPFISPTASNINVTNQGENVFRCIFTDPFQGKVLAQFGRNNLKGKRAAIFYNKTLEYSIGLADVFKTEFEKLGGEIVYNYSYKQNDKDFILYLKKIKDSEAEILFIPEYDTQIIKTILIQAKSLDLKINYLGSDGWDYLAKSISKSTLLGQAFYTTSFSLADDSAIAKEFISRFQSEYNLLPQPDSALAYDTANILFAAIKRAGTLEKKKLVKEIKNTKLNGVTGYLEYDSHGNPLKSATIIKISNGQVKYFTKVQP